MTTLAKFYTYVSTEARRGSSLDEVIPRKVIQAVRFFERMYTYKHMERFISVPIPMTPTGGIAANQLIMPQGFKSMGFWRLKNSDPSGNSTVITYSRINKIDPTDQSQLDSGPPQGFWQDGYGNFWLDKMPDMDYASEMGFVGYTVLPNPGDSTVDIPLLTNFEECILYTTLVLLAPTMRSDDANTMYRAVRDECIKTAIDTDIENRQASRSESMQYAWDWKEEVNLSSSTSLGQPDTTFL